ncbi:NAD(P)/FAD-dependent oxidoreductase [Hymenobacter terrenus]|uniref:NAD(P)/FAD-dependent oxidoreductase n=1 Tax=Hymenobacter terrenus TaxID=1629124 RepID=UPI000619A694|nr:NAD(P)/FAD-dependent oxidoreductase [Hymenobacter terrenus]
MRKSPFPTQASYDMMIVGASNAGLSAALVLGRARRRVLVLDGGPARNAVAFNSHSFFTRDGSSPGEVLRIGREQLRPYAVEIHADEASQARLSSNGLVLTLGSGAKVTAPALVLATGVTDELPPVPGLSELWGRGAYHCPYCHGWENRYNQVAVYGQGEAGYQQAVLLHQWSPQLTLCTDGPANLTAAQYEHLAHLNIAVLETPVAAIDGSIKCLRAIAFRDGSRLPVDAIFLRPIQRQRSDLAAQLGCDFTPDGMYVQVNETGLTSVPGVYAVGDMTGPFQQAILAAASGTRAAAALNNELILRDSVLA